MPGSVLDTAFIELLPKFDRFGPTIKAEVDRSMRRVESTVKAAGTTVERELTGSARDAGRGIQRELGQAGRGAERSLRQLGDEGERQFDRVEREARDASRAASGHWRAIGSVLRATFFGLAGAGVAAAVGLAKATRSAADLGESVNAIHVVAGDAANEILRYTEGARRMGLTQAELNQQLVPTISLFQDAAAEGLDLGKTVKTLSDRAADTASVFNKDVNVVLEAFNAGIRGEFEPLRQFGVNLDQATVSARAVELGLAKSTDSVSRMDTTLAAYDLIMQQTNLHQGDLAKTADSLPNRWRRITATVRELGTALGERLLPLADRIITWGEAWGQTHGPAVRRAFDDVKTAVGTLIDKARTWWQTDGPKVKQAFDDAKTAVFGVRGELAKIRQSWDDNKEAVDRLRLSLGITSDSLGFLRTLVQRIGEEIRGAITIVGWFARALKLLALAAGLTARAIIDIGIAILTVISKIPFLPPAWRRGLKSALADLKDWRQKTQEQIDEIKGKKVTISVTARADFNALRKKMGGLPGVSTTNLQRMTGMREGGLAEGPGTTTSDSIFARLSKREFVQPAEATDYYGVGFMEAVRRRLLPRYATGGLVRIDQRTGGTAELGRRTALAQRVTVEEVTRSVRAVTQLAANAVAQQVVEFMLGGGGVGGSLPGATGSVNVIAQKTAGLLRRFGEWMSWARRIMFESGGHWDVVNRWDSNWFAGHPSVGGAQVIRGTFQRWAGPFRNVGPFRYGVSINPLANSYAGGNYAVHRYGSLRAVDPRVRPRGYDLGGSLMPGWNLAWNGTGRVEQVLPPDAGAGRQVTINNAPGTVQVNLNGPIDSATLPQVRAVVEGAFREFERTLRVGEFT
jgi:SLT domain-containing protein